MSSGCGDVLSLEDLKTAKLHQTFEAEVITGLSGGVSGGDSIDYATNPVTSQTQKTLPAILRDMGFTPASFTFTSGGTLAVGDSNVAVLWPVADGGDGDYYYWKGSYPKVVPASSTPATSGGVSQSGWMPAGDITLRSELASSDTGEGDALIKVLQPFTGAVEMTQHQKNQQVIDARDFGVVADGVTDDSAALNAALAYSGYVDLPPGTILLGSAVSVSGKAVRLRGKGSGITVLKSTITSGAMLTISPTSGDHFFDIGDFSCTSTALSTAGVSAIIIDGSSQVTTSTYKTMYLVGEREKRRGIASNIDFVPTDSTHGFGYGLRVKCLLNYKISDMTFTGPSGSYSYEAYAIEGQGVPVDIRMNNVYAYNCAIGLNMPDYVEALYLREFEFVNVTRGINSLFISGRSVVPDTVTERSNSLKIGPGHVNCVGPTSINLAGAPYLTVDGMLIINGDQSETQKIGINIAGGNYVKIRGNQFVSTLGTTTNTDAMFCIVGSAITNSQISHNAANGYNELVHLSGASVTNVLSDNINISGGVGVAVLLADSDSVANTIFNNKSDGSVVASYASTQNNVGVTDYVAYTTITVSAISSGSSQDLAVTVPANIYKSAPDVASLVSANGANNLVGEYLPGSSSATSLYFRVHSAAGAAVSAGTYNVCVRAAKTTG